MNKKLRVHGVHGKMGYYCNVDDMFKQTKTKSMEHPTLKVQLKTVAEFMGFKVYPDDAYVMPAAYNCIKQKDVPIYYDDYKAFMEAWVRFRDSPAPDGHHVEFFDRLNTLGVIVAFQPLTEAFSRLYEAIYWYKSIK